MEQNQNIGSVRDFLTVLFKHKKKIIIIFFAFVIFVAIFSFLFPPIYKAESEFVVKWGLEYVSSAVDKNGISSQGNMGQGPDMEEVVNSEIEILKNLHSIEKVVREITVVKLYPFLDPDVSKMTPFQHFSYDTRKKLSDFNEWVKSIASDINGSQPPKKMTPLEAAVELVEKKLVVDAVKKSSAITVSFKHSSPQLAAQVVNRLVELYKEKHLEVFSDPQSSFLEQQRNTFFDKLMESESTLRSFKETNKVFSLEEQRTLLLNQRGDLDTALKNTQTTVAELIERIHSLRNQEAALAADKALYTHSERDKIIVDSKSQLLTLRLRESELLGMYNESNRLVVNVRKEIRMVEDFIKEQEAAIGEITRTGNVVYQSIKTDMEKTVADLNSKEKGAASLVAQIDKLDKEIESIDSRLNERDDLTRNRTLNEKNYMTYADKVEDARITGDMSRRKMTNISVIQSAGTPTKPWFPKKGLFIALSIIIGPFLGVGYAFFSEFASQSFSNPEQVEKQLGLPVLVAVSDKRIRY